MSVHNRPRLLQPINQQPHKCPVAVICVATRHVQKNPCHFVALTGQFDTCNDIAPIVTGRQLGIGFTACNIRQTVQRHPFRVTIRQRICMQRQEQIRRRAAGPGHGPGVGGRRGRAAPLARHD